MRLKVYIFETPTAYRLSAGGNLREMHVRAAKNIL